MFIKNIQNNNMRYIIYHNKDIICSFVSENEGIHYICNIISLDRNHRENQYEVFDTVKNKLVFSTCYHSKL